MVRSMIAEKNIPKKLWPEAVIWATFVLNRSPTLAVKDITPEEAWSGIKPSVHFFKVFGCLAYVHVPDALRKKLDPKGVKCVHLGISNESKDYKLYDPLHKKIIVSRDVVFDESKGWNWNDKPTTTSTHIEVESDDEIITGREELDEASQNSQS
jgi:hypothetical protein